MWNATIYEWFLHWQIGRKKEAQWNKSTTEDLDGDNSDSKFYFFDTYCINKSWVWCLVYFFTIICYNMCKSHSDNEKNCQYWGNNTDY